MAFYCKPSPGSVFLGRHVAAPGQSVEEWEKARNIGQEKVWRALRYLVKGQREWSNLWVDTSLHKDPFAWIQERLGSWLEAVEYIPDIEGLTMRQVLIKGEMSRIELPMKRRAPRSKVAASLH